MKTRTEICFAITAPGLEEVCAAELSALGVAGVKRLDGGIQFEGGLRDIYRANLWLRTASRVLVRVGEVKSRDFPDLFRKAVRLPWGKFVRPDAAIRVRVSSRRSRLVHGERIASTVADAVDRSLGRGKLPPEGEGQLVLARFEDDRCTFSIDSSGELLHRRGYRVATTPAPLRETLAAGILQMLGWEGSTALADPLCGSGTFLIEAALLARALPPGGRRRFAFMGWPRYRPGLWHALLAEAERQARSSSPPLCGGDRDDRALAAARQNAERAGVLADLRIVRQPLSEAEPCAESGLLLCNPPYGARLDSGRDLRPLYRMLGRICRESFPQWRWAFLCPDESLARATGLEVVKLADLINGGLRVGLYACDEFFRPVR